MATAAAPDTPRITYHAPGRTFDRLFKEASLAETKDVVRAKLRLAPGARVALTQLRDGQRIDLEDDGDFEALKALASAVGHVVVLVSVDGQTWPGLDGPRPVEGGTGVSNALTLSKKARRRARSVAAPAELPAMSAPASDTENSGPKRKKRKVAFDEPPSIAGPAASDVLEKRKRKDKAKAGPSSQPDILPDSTSPEIAMPKPIEAQPPQPGPSRSRSATRESEISLESDKKVKKHKKKKSQSDAEAEAAPASPAITTTEEAVAPPASRPSPTPIHRPSSRARAPSPERKRKRKRHASPSPSETPAPAAEAQSLEPPKKKKKKNKHKADVDVTSASVPPSPKGEQVEGEESVQAPAVAESVETPAKKKKNKQKADVDILSAPLPLSTQKDVPAETDESVQALAGPESIETPAKKKRKSKRAQDAGAPSASTSSSPTDARARGEEALEALAALAAAPESIEPPAKKKKKSRHTEVDPASIPLPPSPKMDAHTEVEEPLKALADSGISEPQEDAGGKVKRKKSKARLDTSPEQDLVPSTAPADLEPTAAEKKLKKRKSKASLPEPAVADPDESISVPVVDMTEPKRGRPKSRPRWAEVSAMHVEQPMSISAPRNASLESKRERRRSKLPAAEQSFSASAPHALKPSKQNPADNFESSSAGHSKAKKGKKSQGPVDPSRLQALEADLQAAFDLVVHGKTAAGSPPTPKPAEALSQPKPVESPSQPAPPPARKRLSKSRLNVSWGPADFAKGVSPEPEAPDSEDEEAVPIVHKSVDVVQKPAAVEEAEVEQSEDEEEVEAGEADEKSVEDAEEEKEDAEEEKEGAEEEKEDAEEEVKAGDTGKVQVSASTPSAVVISPSISRTGTSAMEGIRRPSTPTFPAGTMISEVTIESRDEGSSNEGSDSESDDLENEAEHAASGDEEEEKPTPALTQVFGQSEGPSSALPPPSSYDDQLEALIRGPRRPGPRRSVLDELPSESTTEDESDKDESPLPVMEEEEEEEEAKERSKSFKKARSASSSDTEPETEAEVDEPPIFMDGSQEVPPVEPPPPAFMEDTLQEPEEVDEKEPSFDVEDNVPEPPADNDVPSDRASEHSTSNAQTAVDGHTSDKAALLSPILGPTAVGPETELQEQTQRRSVSPDSEATVKGGEDREALTTKEPETSDQSPSRDVDTGANDVAIPESEPTSPVVDHEVEEERVVVKPIQAEGSASQASSIADEESQQLSIADDTATQKPSTAGNDDEIESIEPADDLEVRRRRVPEPDDDPIEFDLTQRVDAAMRTPSPAAASSRPGTIQRMKDRNGKRVSVGIGLPVLASQTSEAANNATTAPARRSGRLASRPSGSQASSHEAAPALVPAPAPAPAPKRRGRQPLSEKEKANRAAAKEAKAAARQAEKEKKARIREEKEREKKEKKEAKAAKKPASKASTTRKAPASKRAATLPPPLEPEPEQAASAAPPASAPQPASPTPSQEATQQSLVAWATLPSESPAPGLAPSEISLADRDQLRSSSPAGNETIIAAKAPSPILVPDSSQPVHESSDDFPYENTPLFLPGSSQYPITQSAMKLSSPPRARAASVSEHSDSDGETPLPQKKRAPTQQRGHPFRRLTDIASQSSLFLSPGVVTSTPYALRPPPGQKRIDHRLGVDDDDDDDDDSSGSDSDAPPKSHIPKNRRAGAGRKSGRPSGLRSLTQ